MCECHKKPYKQKKNGKDKNKKQKWLLLSLIICILFGMILDIAFKYVSPIKNYIKSNMFQLLTFLFETVFSDKVTIILSVCTTIGSITFSIFSFATNSFINNQKKLVIDSKYCKLLGINVTYNPYIFIAIGMQCFAILLRWYTLFYIMVGYQAFSFMICLSNYLKLIDYEKFKNQINNCERDLEEGDEKTPELLHHRLTSMFIEKSYWLDYQTDIFYKFGVYLKNKILNKEKLESNENLISGEVSEDDIKNFKNRSKDVINNILGEEKNDEKKFEIIYALAIVIAPDVLIKNLENTNIPFFELCGGNNNEKHLSFEYWVFYYFLIFYLIKKAPELLNRKRFEKVLISNEEICNAIILNLQYNYFLYSSYTSKKDKELYDHCIDVISNSRAANRCEDNIRISKKILYTYWLEWYKEDCDNYNFYEIGRQYEQVQKILNEIEIIRNKQLCLN